MKVADDAALRERGRARAGRARSARRRSRIRERLAARRQAHPLRQRRLGHRCQRLGARLRRSAAGLPAGARGLARRWSRPPSPRSPTTSAPTSSSCASSSRRRGRDDVAVAISTSGGSRNVIAALEEARKRGLLTVALLGYDGGEIGRRGLADHALVVALATTSRASRRSRPRSTTSCARAAGGARRHERSSSCSARPGCPYTRELREWLEWRRRATSSSTTSRPTRAPVARLRALAGGRRDRAGPGRGRRGRAGRAGRAAAAWSTGDVAASRRGERRRGCSGRQGELRPRPRRRSRASASGRSSSASRAPTRLTGWVLNGNEGVEIHVEGPTGAMDGLPARAASRQPPPAASITAIDVEDRAAERPRRASSSAPAAASDAAHGAHLAGPAGLRRPASRSCSIPPIARYGYPYINCTDCGPRYTIILAPALRPAAHHDARRGRMCERCARASIDDPLEPPVPRAAGGLSGAAARTTSWSRTARRERRRRSRDRARRRAAPRRARSLAVKGIGGYHLACDARNADAVGALRERKLPQGEAVRADGARPRRRRAALVELDAAAEALLGVAARPIVLAPARRARSPASRPTTDELGVMLPYTPLHHLLFAAGAPEVLVMTSANRSSEPIAYRDDDALRAARRPRRRLSGRRAADRPPGRRLGRRGLGAGSGRSCAARAATRPARWRALPSADSVLARRRRPEEHGHAGRRTARRS